MALKYLDLVALAGAADIVPLVDENRVLVKEEESILSTQIHDRNCCTIKGARMEPGNLNAGQIVYNCARINAVGRLGDANRAVDLFTTDDPRKQ